MRIVNGGEKANSSKVAAATKPNSIIRNLSEGFEIYSNEFEELLINYVSMR